MTRVFPNAASITIRTTRWIFLATSLYAGLGSAACGADLESRPEHPPARPNILFLLADDQRADTIAALGNTQITTPNLDRLVREGTAFTRAYCMGSHHGAVCIPSRAMILTGRTLFHIKEDMAGQDSWPEAFARAGYSTFLTGKWHNQRTSATRLFQSGKAIFLGGMGDPYALPVCDISAQHTLVNERVRPEHSVRQFADQASEFLRRQTAEKPFLCYVAFNLPHDPRVAEASFHHGYDAHKPPLPPNFQPLHSLDNGALTTRDEALAPWPRTPEIVRQHLADYFASIEFLDAQIGRILEALRASGQYERTIVVFASDHGLAIGSHGLFGKQNLYEHSMRSPLILAGPGIPRGQRSNAMCYLLDIFPTLGELVRVAAPQGSEGRSCVPSLNDPAHKGRESIFSAYADTQRAVRDERYKLIVYPKINRTQLFDLQDDPFERRDLSSDSQHASDRTRLLELMRTRQKELGDTLALSTPNPEPAVFDFAKLKSPSTTAVLQGAGHSHAPRSGAAEKPVRGRVKSVDIVILSTMLADHAGIGEWGFSALVTADGHRILFDTGLLPETVLRNARELNVDLKDVPEVILSHHHGDHTGGLLTLRRTLARENQKNLATAHVGSGIFFSRPGSDGHESNEALGIKAEFEALGGSFVIVEKPTELFPGVWLTGPVPRTYPERNWSLKRTIRLPDGKRVEDNVPEDMSLVLDTEQGLVVISGCGHAGIVNTLEFVRHQVRDVPVYAALGGFHLFEADQRSLDWTASKLKVMGLANLLGAHCTGIEAVFGLRQRLALAPKNCAVGAVGARFSLKTGLDPGSIAR
jgi:arylsulfatase A-like enzyme/metal-dependent hydrolase (beta-lactamase superfamily II)